MSKKSSITEKNVPTNPSLWQKFVAQAKRKFDVYPSAYANGWASKQYKDAGGKWKTEGVEEPEHVAAGLPQTKELKGKKIGERFLEYLQDNGLKHAAYQNEEGSVKVIGLNKEQVKEAIKNCVEGYLKKKVSEVGLPGGAGVGVSLPGGYINGAPNSDDVKKMKAKLKEADEEGNGESKKFPGHYHLGGGYYSTTKDGEAVKKSDKGQLRNLTPQEKAEKEAEKTGAKAQPAAQQPTAAAKPAGTDAAAARAGAKPEAPKPTQPAAKPETPTAAKSQEPTTPAPKKPDTSKMSPEDKKATEEYEHEKEGLDHHEKAAYEFLDGIPPEKKAEAINQALENRSFWQKFSQDTLVGSWLKKKAKQFADTGAGLKSLFSGRKPRRFGVVQDCSEAPKESIENLKEAPKDRQDYLASLGKGGAPKPEEPKQDKDTSGCKPVHYEDFMEKDEQGNPVYEEKEEPVYKQGKKPDVAWAVSYGGKFNNNEIDPKTGFYLRDGKYYGFDEKEVDKDGNLLGKDGKPKPATNLLGKPKTRKVKVPKFRSDLTPEQLDLAHESHHASHEQRHAVIHTATEVGMVVAGVATGGLLAGAGKTAFGMTTGTTAAAEHGIMHTVMHVATHTVKDIGKHAALEVLGAPDAYTAGGIGAGLTFATGGVLENNSVLKQLFLISENNGGDEQKNSQFYQDLLKKTMEKMKTFEMTPQQKLQSIKDYKKKKAEGGFEKKEPAPMNESVNKDRVKEIGNFVEFATKRLKLNERPKVKLVKEADYIAKAIGEDGASALASFVPSENKILVVNDGRLVADVLRSIAHEMVHRKQQELGMLDDIYEAGKTGSKIENQANSIAGILLREYGKKNKTIYEIRLNESVFNQIEKEVSELYTETQSLKEYIQKQIK